MLQLKFGSYKKMISGAGVVLIEVGKNRKNPHVILVQEVKGYYTEPGGKREIGTSITEAARDELYEETARYILFKNANALYQKNNWSTVPDRTYRFYVILIDKIDVDGYFDNLEFDDEKKFRETNFMTKVSIKRLRKVLKVDGDEINVEDYLGENIWLKRRTVSVLREMFDILYDDIIVNNPVLPYKREENDYKTLVF